MRATETIFIDLQRLYDSGPDAVLIVQLMRAADDIVLANWGLSHFKSELPNLQKHVQLGACRYFVRLQCGHLAEALGLIEEFNQRPILVDMLAKCQSHVQNAYGRLIEVLPGGSQREKYEKWILPIRNRLAFHYDPSLIERALKRRALNPASRKSTITRGSEMKLWRFNVADDVEDSIVCRELWKIPLNSDLLIEANKRADFGSDLCRDFIDFVGELAFLYAREFSAY
ncbi:MAG: hypothetical protein LUQ38_12575 [Methanotrichaceae archaeon]|nr:hypothetical protein [Methanotrichaceae archaeon]